MAQVDAATFHARVYEIVRLIPSGKVTTYGHIAKLAGSPRHSRMVGAALKFLQDQTVPWQRVLGASGAISDRGDGGEGAARQADRLRQENVEVSTTLGGGVSTTQRGGTYRVSLARYGWFPESVELESDGDDGEAGGSER